MVVLGAGPGTLLPVELLGSTSPKDILHNMDDGGGPSGRRSAQIFSQRGKSHSVKGNERKNRDLEKRKKCVLLLLQWSASSSLGDPLLL